MKPGFFAPCAFIACSLAIAPGMAFPQASTLSKAVSTSGSMEPAIPLPEQDQVAQKQLVDLRAKTGKRPNIVWLIVDDMGYGDPGAFGGGVVAPAGIYRFGGLGKNSKLCKKGEATGWLCRREIGKSCSKTCAQAGHCRA